MKARAMPGHLIRRLQQWAVQQFALHMREVGLDITPVQFAALDAIHAHPGVDQARLAALIAYDRATLGGVIDRLAAKDLIRREVSPHDRRAREVRLTPAGEALHRTLLPAVERVQDDILARLDAGERDLFVALARKALGGEMADDPG